MRSPVDVDLCGRLDDDDDDDDGLHSKVQTAPFVVGTSCVVLGRLRTSDAEFL